MPVIVLAGGDLVPEDVLEDLPPDAYVIAANSGARLAESLGLQIDLLVGDLDSIDDITLHRLGGVLTEKYPADKDETDLELALAAALRLEADRILVVGGHGGRLDHLLANAALLARPDFAASRIEWLTGDSHVHIVHTGVQLHGIPGDPVSLLAMNGPASGIKSRGLRWELDGDELLPGSTRGVSNEMTRPVASVTLEDGVLLVVQVAG